MNILSNMTSLILAGILLTPIAGTEAAQAEGTDGGADTYQLDPQEFQNQLIEDDVRSSESSITKVDPNADMNAVHSDDQDLVIQKFGTY